MEKKLGIEQQTLEEKKKELEVAKQNIGRAMEIANDLNRNAAENEVNETEVRNSSEAKLQNDTEGLLKWVLFWFKFAAELTLGILEFWDNKKHLKILIAAIVLATFSLTINVVEIFRSF